MGEVTFLTTTTNLKAEKFYAELASGSINRDGRDVVQNRAREGTPVLQLRGEFPDG